MGMGMFTMLASVLVVRDFIVGAMLVNMGMLVFMLMCMTQSRAMLMLMAMDVLMRMGTFHAVAPLMRYLNHTTIGGRKEPTEFNWIVGLGFRFKDDYEISVYREHDLSLDKLGTVIQE